MDSRAVERLRTELGLKRLSPLWAKLEILAGLTAAGGGLFLGTWATSRAAVEWLPLGAGLALFVLGGYLASAGHRSHHYQSNNQLTAYLADLIRASRGDTETKE